MTATLQIVGAEPQALQPAAHRRYVRRLTGVRGAGERDLMLGEPETVGGAALDQGQRLEGLQGGAREDRTVDVAVG